MQLATLPAAVSSSDNTAYLAAYAMAAERAPWTDYDVHVIRNADGSYWYTDEGDYACDLSEIEDRIVHTLPGRMHGLY